jgi:hypothetical protein
MASSTVRDVLFRKMVSDASLLIVRRLNHPTFIKRSTPVSNFEIASSQAAASLVDDFEALPLQHGISIPADRRLSEGYCRKDAWARIGFGASDPLLPSAIQSSCVAVFLFDRLVRAQQDRCRHIEAKRLGGRHIEHGLVFHRQLHRQIGRLLALKDAVDVGGGAASMAYLVRPI